MSAPLDLDYVRCPADIYRESFRRVRECTDLARFPADIADIVVRIVHACGMPEVARDIHYTADVVRQARRALANGGSIICDTEMTRHGIIRTALPRDNPVLCPLTDARCADLAKQHDTTRAAAAVELWRAHLDGAVVVIGNAPTALFRLLEVLGESAESDNNSRLAGDSTGQMSDGGDGFQRMTSDGAGRVTGDGFQRMTGDGHGDNDGKCGGDATMGKRLPTKKSAHRAPRPAAILAFPVGFIGAAESCQALIAHSTVPYITLAGRRGGSAMAAAAVNALAGGSANERRQHTSGARR